MKGGLHIRKFAPDRGVMCGRSNVPDAKSFRVSGIFPPEDERRCMRCLSRYLETARKIMPALDALRFVGRKADKWWPDRGQFYVLLGEAPSRFGQGPLEGRGTGLKLAELSGLGEADYMRSFARRNIFGEPQPKEGKGRAFPVDEARSSFESEVLDFHGRRVVVLGRRVAEAVGLDDQAEWFTWYGVDADAGGEKVSFSAAIMPHPSGINRWWNKESNRLDATRWFWDVASTARLLEGTNGLLRVFEKPSGR